MVLKVASRCNLNCTYCYMYNMGDLTYKNQPKFMSDAVVDALLHRVKEHVETHKLRVFFLIFHGGEPLMAPKKFYRNFIAKARKLIDPEQTDLRFMMQTNGVLITEEWCKLFEELRISVGISMDGTPKAHNMYRIDHKGRGSYDNVVRGLQIFRRHFKRVGVITVFNIKENPIEIYEHFKSLGVTNYSILLPDMHYDNPPGLFGIDHTNGRTPVADWLIPLFDHWMADTCPDKPKVQIFETLIELMFGKEGSGNEVLGGGQNDTLIIETNGDIETVDTLKACGHGFTKGNMSVFSNSIDEAQNTPLIRLYFDSHKNLCAQCRACPLNEVCGGGYLVTRYSAENGFDNPSIYCRDLMKLIVYIQNRILRLMPESYLQQTGMELLSVAEVLEIIEQNLAASSMQPVLETAC